MPIGLVVAGANRNDFKLLRESIESIVVERPQPTEEQAQGMCLDKGYDFYEVRNILQEFAFTAHIRARGEEAQALKREAGCKARSWVVERTHSWMNRFRAIPIRWRRRRPTILPFSTSPAPISPSSKLAYWDILLLRPNHNVYKRRYIVDASRR